MLAPRLVVGNARSNVHHEVVRGKASVSDKVIGSDTEDNALRTPERLKADSVELAKAAAVLYAGSALHAYTVVKLWDWFAPKTAPRIGMVQAVGLTSLVTMFRPNPAAKTTWAELKNKPQPTPEEIYVPAALKAGVTLMVLATGAVLKRFVK